LTGTSGNRACHCYLLDPLPLVSLAHRDVQLQGALARPKGTKFVRPDFCIGPNVTLSDDWVKLRAGQAIFPLDIGEYKSAHCAEDMWYAVGCHAGIIGASFLCELFQLSLVTLCSQGPIGLRLHNLRTPTTRFAQRVHRDGGKNGRERRVPHRVPDLV